MPTENEMGKFGGDSLEDTSSKPWEKKRPELPLSEKDFHGALKIVKANMLHIEKKQLGTRAYNRLKRLAAFRNPEFYEAQMMHRDTGLIPRVLSTADELGGFLRLPRGIEDSLRKILQDGGIEYEVIDRTQVGKRIHVRFNGELRDDQPEVIKALTSHNTGVLDLPTGSGKTVVGIKAIAEKSVNTLILVNNKNLLAQWKEKLAEFLVISDEPPLYYTPTGRERRCPVVGEYSGTKKQLSGLVDIAMMQSLFRDGEVNDLIKDYGMVIIDECHHIPSFSFTSVLKAINAKYLYGLTATPERKDGHEIILYMQCGPTRYRIDPLEQARKRSFEQIVIPRFTNSLPDDPSEKFNITKLYGELAADHKRNELIVSDVLSCLKEKRNPLVLTERTEHVNELTCLIKAHFENVLFITGKMSDPEKRVFQNRIRSLGESEQFVIVATGKYIGEGFDLDRLDTLFLTLPISWKNTIKQYTGRLHRTHEGKSRVEVYDYVDIRIPQLERMYRKRLKAYKSVGYKAATKGIGIASEDIIYGPDSYQEALTRDIQNARNEVILCSPHLLYRKVAIFAAILQDLQSEEIRVSIFTNQPKSPSSPARQQRAKVVDFLKNTDIPFHQEQGFNHQFVIIDKRIAWYGSINFLGSNAADDGAIRIVDPEVATALKDQLDYPRR